MTMDKLSSQGTPEEIKQTEGLMSKKQEALSQSWEKGFNNLNQEEQMLARNANFRISWEVGHRPSGLHSFVNGDKAYIHIGYDGKASGGFIFKAGQKEAYSLNLSLEEAQKLYDKYYKVALFQYEINKSTEKEHFSLVRCSVCDANLPNEMIEGHRKWHDMDELYCENEHPLAHNAGDCPSCSAFLELKFTPIGEEKWACRCGRTVPHEWRPGCHQI